jgi:tol-pal system protein YbgF
MLSRVSKLTARWVLLVALGAFAGSSQAGLFDDEEARQAILQLREQRAQDKAAMTALQEKVDALSRGLLDVNTRLEAMRGDLAQMQGKHELLSKAVSDLQQGQKELRAGVDERVSRLEPKDVTVDGKTFKAAPEEIDLFEKALVAMRGADFSAALDQFTALLKQYPATGYRESALYWQGNAFYGLGNCTSAVNAFQALVSSASAHQRAPESLLAIASCHAEQKAAKKAKTVLETLVKTYPDSEAAQVARERLLALSAPEKKK